MVSRTQVMNLSDIDVEGGFKKRSATRSIDLSEPENVEFAGPDPVRQVDLNTPENVENITDAGDLTDSSSEKVAGSTLSPDAFRTARVTSAAIGVLAGVENANAEFRQFSNRARLNISLLNHTIATARSVGKEKALKAESIGFARGEAALLEAAAQGQDVRGEFAQRMQRSEEIFGIQNAMQIETNSIREIYGLEAQQEILESDIEFANIARERKITNAYLQGAASVLGTI